MKITIKENAKQAEIKYPCLMSATFGTIILFYEKNAGVVIKCDHYKTGHHSSTWNSTLFTPLTGTVELSND